MFSIRTSAESMKNIADMKFGLVLLLLLLNYSSAQDANCNFYQSVAAGGTAYINSPNYPNYYGRGVTCRWIVTCPPGYNCRLDCPEIRIPLTSQCSGDRLFVSRSGDDTLVAVDPGYCGTGSLSGVVSTNQKIVIGLRSSPTSAGGLFQCTVRPQAAPGCTCGVRRQNRIVGGQETGVNEFTMMAGLADLRTSQITCGAVIISDNYVVTAAHCMVGQSTSNYGVVVGEHDVTTGDSPATKAYAITSIIIHQSYNPSNYDYDIAVLRTAQPIVFSDLVRPVCMPMRFLSSDFAGSKVIALGWGTLFIGGPTSNVLRMVDLDVLSQATCRSRGAAVTDRQMCTFTSGKDACQYDSGGPLLWTDPNTGAVHFVGIISYGRSCASSTPGINTRVTSLWNWIKTVTNTNDGNYCLR